MNKCHKIYLSGRFEKFNPGLSANRPSNNWALKDISEMSRNKPFDCRARYFGAIYRAFKA